MALLAEWTAEMRCSRFVDLDDIEILKWIKARVL